MTSPSLRLSGSTLAVVGDGTNTFDVRVPMTMTYGLTGSITKLQSGVSYLVAGENIAISTSSNGQVVISATSPAGGSGPGDGNASYVVLSNTGSLASERALTAGTGITITDAGANSTVTMAINNNVVATVSGTKFTGVVSCSAGLSGSLQQVGPGIPYIVGGTGIAVSTSSNGQLVVTNLGLPTGFADVSASYITIATTGTLPNERVLTAGSNITITDGGAGSTITISSVPANAISALTQSLSYSAAGNGTLSIIHSGAVVSTYDAWFRTTELKSRWRTTSAGTTTGIQFISGANGRSYSIDARLQAQHTSTYECAEWRFAGHAYCLGGTMSWVRMDSAVSSSVVSALSASLALSAGNIIVQSVSNSGSFDWGAWMRVQELGH